MSERNISVKQLDGTDKGVTIVGEPDECPRCHRHIHPKQFWGFGNNIQVQIVFQCTSRDCALPFFGNYLHRGNNIFHLSGCNPKDYVEHKFPDTIKTLSPIFCEIYNQAIDAETKGLNQLVGIGLRKALEFLIKDFAVHSRPEKDKEIKASTLVQCINNFCGDANVKKCAERATWLGNDETHYVRKFEDKDIQDLKRLTKLSVNWIENVILTEKYEQEMTKKSP